MISSGTVAYARTAVCMRPTSLTRPPGAKQWAVRILGIEFFVAWTGRYPTDDLGHADERTTMNNTHVLQQMGGRGMRSPLCRLEEAGVRS